MRALLLGAGNMGRAIRSALEARGDTVVASLGRVRATDAPTRGWRRRWRRWTSRSSSATRMRCCANARLAAAAGARVLVIGTTGWAHDAPDR